MELAKVNWTILLQKQLSQIINATQRDSDSLRTFVVSQKVMFLSLIQLSNFIFSDMSMSNTVLIDFQKSSKFGEKMLTKYTYLHIEIQRNFPLLQIFFNFSIYILDFQETKRNSWKYSFHPILRRYLMKIYFIYFIILAFLALIKLNYFSILYLKAPQFLKQKR